MIEEFIEGLEEEFESNTIIHEFDEVTMVVDKSVLESTCLKLRDYFGFEMLIDLCGLDFLTYGESEWDGNASSSGFGRARESHTSENPHPERFAVTYHLLSTNKNQRLRLRVYLNEEMPIVSSVSHVWSSANWYEREAFDLFGILFENHPDLRRILTDYGFVGHPLRKDFPMIGEVEMRYDEKLGRVIYEPVSIEPNINVPRIIRK